jgi:hypothetical protein
VAVFYSPLVVGIARDLVADKRLHPMYVWVGAPLVTYDFVIFPFTFPKCGLATGGPVAAWRALRLTFRCTRRHPRRSRAARRGRRGVSGNVTPQSESKSRIGMPLSESTTS